jgi:hypothetical protein
MILTQLTLRRRVHRGFFSSLRSLFWVVALVGASSASAQSLFEASQKIKVLGTKNAVELNIERDDELRSVNQNLSIQALGKNASVFSMSIPEENGDEDTVFVGKVRVLSQKIKYENGAWRASVQIPAVKVSIPVFRYPVGPVLLSLKAGYFVEALAEISLKPSLSIPIQFTQLEISSAPEIAAYGFIDGTASLLFVRAGLGFELKAIDAKLDLSAKMAVYQIQNGQKPDIHIAGQIHLMAGRVHAYADYYNLLRLKWKRFWDPDILKWDGYCLAFDKDHRYESKGQCQIKTAPQSLGIL